MSIPEIGKNQKVLDVGGGHNSFQLATHVIDWRKEEDRNNVKYIVMDACSEKFPFKDKEVDFVFCRHTLEDMHNPMFALKEMMRVGKNGYIETPHVITELNTGFEGEWRGWAHHFWFVWHVENTLYLLPKSNVVHGMKINESIFPRERKIISQKFYWKDDFKIVQYVNGRDFHYLRDYDIMIANAIFQSTGGKNAI